MKNRARTWQLHLNILPKYLTSHSIHWCTIGENWYFSGTRKPSPDGDDDIDLNFCIMIQTWSLSATQALWGLMLAMMEWRSCRVVHSCWRHEGLNMNCLDVTNTLKPPSPSRIISVPQSILTTRPSLTVSLSPSCLKLSTPRRQKSSSLPEAETRPDLLYCEALTLLVPTRLAGEED